MIWVTRSEPGATRLARVLTEQGHSVWCAPVIEVTPLRPWISHSYEANENDLPSTAAGAVPASAPDLVIALSAHAVQEYVLTPLADLGRSAEYVAIGSHTGGMLQDLLGCSVRLAQPATSEGLLQMPVITGLSAQQQVWLLAGEGGRDLVLQHLLHNIGCRVVKFELYQRRAVQVADIPVARIGIVVLGSQAGLEQFEQLWRGQGGSDAVRLVVPSMRVAERARAMGFENVHNARGATPENVVAEISG